MRINSVVSVCFSPALHTKAVQGALLERMPFPHEVRDLTPYDCRDQKVSLGTGQILLLSAPVFAGRIPQPAAQRFRQLQGQGNPAILVATFGNRAFEDALLEMQELLEDRGFVVVGAAAVVTEHSIAKGYAADRPDGVDWQAIAAFAQDCIRKIEGAEEVSWARIQTPGNHPYREAGGKHSVPVANESCISCGRCMRACPVGAIPPSHLREADPARCIDCMACVWNCPVNVRSIPAEDVERIRSYLEGIEPPRKNNCFYM